MQARTPVGDTMGEWATPPCTLQSGYRESAAWCWQQSLCLAAKGGRTVTRRASSQWPGMRSLMSG